MVETELTDQNFLLYAAKNYNQTSFDDKEFLLELKRFKYLKRLFNQYQVSNEIKERLVLNHIIILGNIFGIEPTVRMLFLKLRGYYSYLKPVLMFLGYMPDTIYNIQKLNIHSDDIIMDTKIIEVLRNI